MVALVVIAFLFVPIASTGLLSGETDAKRAIRFAWYAAWIVFLILAILSQDWLRCSVGDLTRDGYECLD